MDETITLNPYDLEETEEKAAGKPYTYNGVGVTATPRRPSDRDDKKYMRDVTYEGKTRVVHYGDPEMPMQRDSPERRASFLARHRCDEKTDPFAPGFWACLDWERTSEGKKEMNSYEDYLDGIQEAEETTLKGAWGKMLDFLSLFGFKAEKPTKTIDGQPRPAGDFLVVEDPEKPTTWHLPVKVNGEVDRRLMGAAKAALTVGYRGNTYAGPDKDAALAKLKKLYEAEGMAWGEEKAFAEGLSVFKDAEGVYRWVAISSNAYRDRDGEIVSTKALENDVARADTDGEYGPLRFWHVPGLDIGECVFNMVKERILIEAGTFENESIALAVKEKADDYEISIGFTHPPDNPDKDGVFHEIRRFERSLVPKGRAANRFTNFSVKGDNLMQNLDEKEKAFTALLGEEIAQTMIQKAETIMKQADASGVAFKETATESEKLPPESEAEEEMEEKETKAVNMKALSTLVEETVNKCMAPYMEKMEKMYASKKDDEQAQFKEAEQAQLTALKEQNAKITALETQLGQALSTLKELASDLPKGLHAGFIASQADGTLVREDDERLKETPHQDPNNNFFAWVTNPNWNAPAQPSN